MTDPADIEEEFLQEIQDTALDEPLDMRQYANNLFGGYRRDPARFETWPSDEQMEYFKRGGR